MAFVVAISCAHESLEQEQLTKALRKSEEER
jgi:hypothetical protein